MASVACMMSYVWVGLGSAIGGVARYGLSAWVDQRIGHVFPFGTVLVNVSGCLAMGILASWTVTEGKVYLSPEMRQLLLIGVMGGYTTFSSFSLQTLNLVRAGEWFYAAGNVTLSVVACLVAVWLGFVAGLWIQKMLGQG